MKYSYQLTKEDWKSLHSLMGTTYKTIERGKKIATIFLIVYGFSYTFYCLWHNQYLAACIFVILILTMYGIFRYACREDIVDKVASKMNNSFLRRNPQFLEPQIVSIENNIVINTLNNGKVYKKSIDDITSLIVSDDFIIIMINGLGCMTAIPSRVFNNEKERNLLIEVLNKNNKIKKP